MTNLLGVLIAALCAHAQKVDQLQVVVQIRVDVGGIRQPVGVGLYAGMFSPPPLLLEHFDHRGKHVLGILVL